MESDLVVLGAGPAGCAAAIVAAGAGLRVTLVEREAFPRHRPGETIHPGLEPLFRQLGAWQRVEAAGYVRHPGIWVRQGGRSRFHSYGADEMGNWLGLQAVRADLDARLLETAIEQGIALQQPCAAQEVITREGRVLGVDTVRGRFSAAVTIDASGGQHWLARRIGIRMRRVSPPLVARYGYVVGSCPACDHSPALSADSEGWTWTARINHRTYHWTRLSFRKGRQTASWMPAEFHGLEPWGPRGGADVTWRTATTAAGPGYFLVGDAAMVLDPASSHGVLRAIMSGMQAGHLAAHVIAGRYPERKATRFYRDWMRRWFDHDVQALAELYGIRPMPDGVHKGNP